MLKALFIILAVALVGHWFLTSSVFWMPSDIWHHSIDLITALTLPVVLLVALGASIAFWLLSMLVGLLVAILLLPVFVILLPLLIVIGLWPLILLGGGLLLWMSYQKVVQE